MLQNEIVTFIDAHMYSHHPDRKGCFNVLYSYDPDEYELLLEEVEGNDDHIEEYIYELDRLECMFGNYMTDELKDEFLKAFDSMFTDRDYNYRMLINRIVASLGNDVTFVVFGDESMINHITKIVFDVRSKVFHVEEVYRAN